MDDGWMQPNMTKTEFLWCSSRGYINCWPHQSLLVAILLIRRQLCLASESGLTEVYQCRRMSHRGHPRLFCCTASALQHLSFSQPWVAHRTGSISGPNMTGSLQCCSCWIAHLPAWSASVCYQCKCSHNLPNFSVWSHHVMLKELHSLRVPLGCI